MGKKRNKKNKKNRLSIRKPVNIYQPEESVFGRGREGSRPNKSFQKLAKQIYGDRFTSKKDQVYGQIGQYSAGAVQDAARRAGINANATSAKEGLKILEQLRNPSFASRAPSKTAPSRAPARSASAPSPATLSSNIPAYTPQFDGGGGGGGGGDDSGYNDQISDLNDQIASLTAGFQSQAQAMQEQLAQEKAAAAEQMAEMQSNFRQQMAATVGTPKVEGIRFQDAGTGGATQRQLARRGVRGTFGRGGERLMKISSLNV